MSYQNFDRWPSYVSASDDIVWEGRYNQYGDNRPNRRTANYPPDDGNYSPLYPWKRPARTPAYPIPAFGNPYQNPRVQRKCHLVCDPFGFAGMLLGQNINSARQIYSPIRVVSINGTPQILTQDFNPRRINVETVNDVITRIFGFY